MSHDTAAFTTAFRVATDGREPYTWQTRLATRADPAEVIAAPTGAGKTEAVVLDWLWRRRLAGDESEAERTPRRLVLAFPMRTLVEQTLGRVRGLVKQLDEGGLLDRDDPLGVHPLMGGAADDTWVRDPAADKILVGTIDMILSRALNRGYGRGRAAWPMDFGLLSCDTQLVLDEVQLLDAAVATSVQLQAFSEDGRLGELPRPRRTVWMSATLLPAWLETGDRRAPVRSARAQIADADRAGALRHRLLAPKRLERVALSPEDTDVVAQLVLAEHERARPGPAGPAPWLTIAMANTVDRAIRLYRALRAAVDDAVILLHSRFRPGDRRQRVEEALAPPPLGGRIIVTTQVIEAGVDLDAGTLITELAPWPSIVQRAGRLNRAGERPSARLVWLDPSDERYPAELTPPYARDELEAARLALRELDGSGFSPLELERWSQADQERYEHLIGTRPHGLLLRRPDLRGLFDNSSTLDGDDVDIASYIRLGDDLDVGVAWRELGDRRPSSRESLPMHGEVCPVPLGRGGREEIAALSPWRWSYRTRAWEPLRPRDLAPGDLLLVDIGKGRYTVREGWDPSAREPVVPLHSGSGQLDGDSGADSDAADLTSSGSRWLTIAQHTNNVVAALEADLARLGLPEEFAAVLRAAARAHDAGKAHPEFQRRLRRSHEEGRVVELEPPHADLWAKSPARGSPPLTPFRHELVSALLLLQRDVEGDDVDLVTYLVAAHHGKLRLAPRFDPDDWAHGRRACLGVVDGDAVPERDEDGIQRPIDLGGGELMPPSSGLDLSVLDMGADRTRVWIERTLDLLDHVGPFTLAYLEGLLRAADQRASAFEQQPARRIEGGAA
jgi:CRISPR-associated endonuclease/helicase Cas3